MIDMAGIPAIPGNMVALREHAMMIAVAGTGYIDTGQQVHNTWQDLRPHYLAPEAGQLLAATGPVATVCRHVGRNLQQARDVLVVYADTVETIQGELDLLRTRAGDVNTSIRDAGEDWRSDHDLVDRRTAVADAITIQAVAFETAQRDCVNGLRALHGQPPLTVDNGDGQIDPATEFGYTLDQYQAAYRADPDQGGGLPWGGHVEPDHPWYVDVVTAPVRFTQGVGDSLVGTAQGLGALIGYDHATGTWTGDTAGAAWTNLGKLVYAAGVYALPGGALRDQAGAIPFLAPGEAGQLLTDTGKALIAWDQWDDDPARAAGHALTNIASAIVGTKGAGATLRVGGAALQLTRHGSLTARTGAVITRAGEAIGRIPTLTEVAGNAWRRLHPTTVPSAPTIIDDVAAPPRRTDTGEGVPGNLADDLAPRPAGEAPTPPTGTGRPLADGDDRPAGANNLADDNDIDEANNADVSPSDRTQTTGTGSLSDDVAPPRTGGTPPASDRTEHTGVAGGERLDGFEAGATLTPPERFSGARRIGGPDLDALSARRYDEIRADPSDVSPIAAHTGVDPSIVQSVRAHLFEAEHDLATGPGTTVRSRFEPDGQIAHLWQASARGEATPAELAKLRRILAHEYVELRLMRDGGLPYRSNSPDAYSGEKGNEPTTDHYGAHDRAPLVNHRREPFDHYSTYGWSPPSRTFAENLTGIDEVIREMLGGQ